MLYMNRPIRRMFDVHSVFAAAIYTLALFRQSEILGSPTPHSPCFWTSPFQLVKMATRRVVVDDIDSGIKYRGSWFQANGQNDNLDNIGNFGRPFKGTSHGVNETASLSYTFTGELGDSIFA